MITAIPKIQAGRAKNIDKYSLARDIYKMVPIACIINTYTRGCKNTTPFGNVLYQFSKIFNDAIQFDCNRLSGFQAAAMYLTINIV